MEELVNQATQSGVTNRAQDEADLSALDARINAILPPQYQGCYEAISPVSMGSAALKFGADGRVAWDDIWTSYCDLALAGGPPHRGTLLEPADADTVAAEPEQYQRVVEEIGRGLWLVIGLPILPRVSPGWVGLVCPDEGLAAWLLRAVTAENVAARQQGKVLLLPAGPRFRLEKEIKNVVTAAAKTCHHWTSHMSTGDRGAAASAFMEQTAATALLEPAAAEVVRAQPELYQGALERLARSIQETTDWPAAAGSVLGWMNVTCPDVAVAVWLLRAMIVDNVLTRREENVLCVPVSWGCVGDADSSRVVGRLARAHRLWKTHAGR
jgi:sirohydrochlorin cobaltochelatase